MKKSHALINPSDPEEIQRAHDLLFGLINAKTPIKFKKRDREEMDRIKVVLCWVLQHDEGHAFSHLLASLENAALEAGCTLSLDNRN